MNRDFSRLLSPRSVALVGGEDWCRSVIRNLRGMGYVWDIWPVPGKDGAIDGVRCFVGIDRLPAPPDLALIEAHGAAAVTAVSQLSARGAGGAICEGRADAGALAEAAGQMALLGPECPGLLNALEHAPIWARSHGLRPLKRGVAIVTRSAAFAEALSMQRRGLPIACITVQPQGGAQTGISALARALLADERISALGVQAEDLGSPQAFIALGREAERLGKSVVVLRAGDERAATALIARAGMARVRSPEGFLEALKILHVLGVLPANAFASLSFSGTSGAVLRDLGVAAGLHFPPLTEPQRIALGADLAPGVALSNPLDARSAAGTSAARVSRIIAEVMSGKAVLTLLSMDHPRADRSCDDSWKQLVDAAAAARRNVGMPLALVSTLPEGMPEELAEALMAQKLIPLSGLSAALEGLRACVELGGPRRIPEDIFVPDRSTPRVPEDAHAALSEQGLEFLPAGTGTAAPGVRLGVVAAGDFGYVMTLRRRAQSVSALLPLRAGEAMALLAGLGVESQAIATLVPALMTVQDYVIAQDGALDELHLMLRLQETGRPRASGLQIRAAGG
ncbi:CoA-binding protein [Citreicella sp. C3M06]|uniref:CoA-binding protein n=1 Tax=Citreicella sp. C3M06 TaxID=2841564 RepID=UPI001C098B6F|nr:CoA-binding protein [Citreicella sp. C3M06]MBU2963375.1 CoA-binding protein [Citreicella sp. C3M06]